jgi:hypothetical protein
MKTTAIVIDVDIDAAYFSSRGSRHSIRSALAQGAGGTGVTASART